MKKIAICLYGQPREYKIGYKNIQHFITQQKNDVDIFFHCWYIEKGQIFNTSPWRFIDKQSLEYIDKELVHNDLLDLYKPKKYKFEKCIDIFDKSLYIDTIAYKNTTNNKMKNNINNTLSQMYSRTEVKKLLEEYVIQTKTEYDYVVITRFDMKKNINLELFNLDKNKVYVSKLHYPRKIIPDNFIICSQSVFLMWFDIYNNLKNLLNNEKINENMKNYKEKLIVNAEELITANFIYNFDINNIVYLSNIINIL